MTTVGRQLAMSSETKSTLLTSPLFQLWCPQGSIEFAELQGITSEVEHHDYAETGPLGAQYGRHVGRRKPPIVTLRRAMRVGPSTTWVWTWHQLVARGVPGARRDCLLSLFGPNDPPDLPAPTSYMLISAFPAKVELAGAKSGGTEVIYQTLTVVCDDMIDAAAA